MSRAIVHFVGAGPGAVDLLTLRGARLLGEAEVVLHDALVAPEMLELAPQALQVDVGKRCGRSESNAQAGINRLLVEYARSHRRVVRLKGGDPSLFGRLDEETEALRQAGLPWAVVPGVTAASGAAAALGRSLTRRGVNRRVMVATPSTAAGVSDPGDWSVGVDGRDTTILYMAGRLATESARQLLARGVAPATPAALVHAATRADQSVQHTTVGALALQRPPVDQRPVLLVVGQVLAEASPAVDATAPVLAASGQGAAVR